MYLLCSMEKLSIMLKLCCCIKANCLDHYVLCIKVLIYCYLFTLDADDDCLKGFILSVKLKNKNGSRIYIRIKNSKVLLLLARI